MSSTASASGLTIEEQWEKFKKDFEKLYSTPEEEQRRFEIFRQNVKGIEEHNAKYARGEVTWTQGINQFTDITSEEFQARGGLINPSRSQSKPDASK